jgi:predicted nucleotidyltransferase
MPIAASELLKVTPEKVDQAVRTLIEVAHPERIILFGSYAQGTHKPDSDLDILVVTNDEATPPHQQTARLRRSLDNVLMSIDIVVAPASKLAELCKQPGLIYREACTKGKVVYERSR